MCVTSEKMGIFTLFLQKNNQKKFGNFSTTDIHPREIINPSHPSASVPSVNIPPIRGKLIKKSLSAQSICISPKFFVLL